MNNNKMKGQILPIIVAIMLFLIIIIPAFITWIKNQSKWSIQQQKKSIAFNLAEAGIDRGLWKLKSSTTTWEMASKGQVISGYNFDTLYDDIKGGVYRIKFSSGPGSREVTIVAEGKDTSLEEVKAIKAVYRNQVIPGAMISKGIITWANAFSAHWGPIMAHNNINITDANAAKDYFPRKFSRQVVSSVPSYPRDTNGLAPPNEGFDWWSDYPVPDLPLLDFSTLRSSASAPAAVYLVYGSQDSSYWYNCYWKAYPYGSSPPAEWVQTVSFPSSHTINTLNVNACSKKTNYNGPKWWQTYTVRKSNRQVTSTNNLSSCNVGGSDHNNVVHFQNSYRHPLARLNRVWFWDAGQDVVFTGSTGDDGGGIIGTVIVQGNLTNYWGDNLDYTKIGIENCKVPSEAWKEYTYIYAKKGNPSGPSDFDMDTSAKNEYPGDDGYQVNRSTFYFGAETWTKGQYTPSAADTDVGLVGFLYVGGNLDIERAMDYYGGLGSRKCCKSNRFVRNVNNFL